MKKATRVTALILSASLVILASGCKREESVSGDVSFGETYPLDTNVTLKYWMPIDENITANVAEYSQTEFAKAAVKQTGVKIEYLHPAIGQETEQFNLLISSGELPDIIESGWYEFPGGPAKAIEDGYIVSLGDYMAKYAPNLSKYLAENPDIDKAIKTDEGEYYEFPFVRGDEKLLISAGPIARMDLIEKLGLAMPVTYDDWYNMLKAFKSAGIEIPLSFNATNSSEITQLLGVFGANTGFYKDGDTVKFGPLEPEYKETLMMLSKWFSEGLLDKNFTTTDSKIRESNVLSGRVGATYGSGGGNLGKWINALPSNSKIKLSALPFPKKTESETGAKFKPVSSPFPGIGAAVSATGKNKELTVKYLDFFYGEEGHRLANFGVEGKSYKMVDGKPTYTDLIMKNPDGLSVSQAMAMYQRAYGAGPFVQSKDYIEQYYALAQQQQALTYWADELSYTQEHMIPKILCSNEESIQMAEITNNINTYVDEMTLKFICGMESFDNWDAFIKQIKKYKADDAIKIQQAAYERYIKR